MGRFLNWCAQQRARFYEFGCESTNACLATADKLYESTQSQTTKKGCRRASIQTLKEYIINDSKKRFRSAGYHPTLFVSVQSPKRYTLELKCIFITIMYPQQISENPPHFILFIALNFSINVFHRVPMRFYRTKDEITVRTILLLFFCNEWLYEPSSDASAKRERGREVCSKIFPQGHPVVSGRFTEVFGAISQS